MFTAVLWCDLLIEQASSLKDKRAVVKSIVNGLRHRFEVAAAETGHQDLHRRALIGVAVVSSQAGHATQVLDTCERFILSFPEVEVVSTQRQLLAATDE